MSHADRPDWLVRLLDAAREVRVEDLTRFAPPAEGGREAAVLVLFGASEAGRPAAGHEPDLLLIERARDLRSHAGQPAFPGGAVDGADDGPVAAALREAAEETGLDPSGVEVVATLPRLWLPPSGFVVTPVLGWWTRPSPVSVVDPVEVASVHRVPIAELADPAARFKVRHPSGWIGPAFGVRGLVVWGFTAGLLDKLLLLGGWTRAWDETVVRDLPDAAVVEADQVEPSRVPRP